MALNDFLGKIDKFLQDGSKKLEDALNGGINSADSAVNQGIDEIRKSTDSMIEKSGIKDYPKEEIPVVSNGVEGLKGLGEAEPNTSIGNIIRPSVGKPEEPKVGPSGEFLYGSVEEPMTINNGKEHIVIENDTTKVNLEKVVINSPICVENNILDGGSIETVSNIENKKKVNLDKE